MDGPWSMRVEGLRGKEQVATFAGGVASLMAALTLGETAIAAAIPALLVTALAAVWYGYFGAAQRARVWVARDELWIEVGRVTRCVARDEVLLALVDPRGTLLLECRRYTLRLTPSGPSLGARRETSDAVVKAMRLAPSQRPLRFTVSDSAIRVLALLLVVPITTALVAGVVAWSLEEILSEAYVNGVCVTLWFTLTAMVASSLWPDTVTLGADGLHVGAPLRERFVPWTAIDDVAVVNGAIVLAPRRAGVFRLTALRQRPAQWDGFVTTARALLAAARAGGSPATARLRREGRDLAAWRAALAEDDGYRDNAVDLAALEAVLRDGGVPPDARVGAALALVAREREAGVARVRIAAEATADPLARDALLAAAAGSGDDSDARITHALTVIERRDG